MSLETELKRRLDVSEQPLAKRLRLAENILSSSYFPVLNKDEIILEWIFKQIHKTSDPTERNAYFLSLKKSLSKEINYKNFTSNFKTNIFKVLSEYLKLENTEKAVVIESCLNFLENTAVSSHLQQSIDEYFTFQTLLLTTIDNQLNKNDKTNMADTEKKYYESLAKRALNDITNFTKSFGKKAILVEAFIDCKTLNIILNFSNDSRFTYKALSICQSIFFPKASVQIYRSYLGALIKGTSIGSLIEEKGESLRSVMKVLDVLFKYDASVESEDDLLNNFIRLFMFCCKSEDIIIYFFNVLLMHYIGIEQDYIQVHGNVSKLDFSENLVQRVYLKNIELLSEFNVNLNIVFSNDATNTESEKTFITFLQQTTHNVLKDKKISQESLLIVKSVILLDPSIFEPLMEEILPNICVQHKNDNLIPTYNSMLLTVLNIQFKLSRGTEFIPKILPAIKKELESIKAQSLDCKDNIKNVKKVIGQHHIFTSDFCFLFGKLASELMSWQNVNILNSLADLLNTHCINNISSQSVDTSVILVTELICSLLNSFFFHIKMADQSLTENIVKKFIENLEHFEAKILAKFGRSVFSSNEKRLVHSFLDLCYIYGQFKLLLCKYQPYFHCPFVGDDGGLNSEKKMKKIGDISMLHSYLSSSEWKDVFNIVKALDDVQCQDAMNRLIIQKLITLDVCNDNETSNGMKIFLKTYVFENIEIFWKIILENNLNGNVLLANLKTEEGRLFANKIVQKFLNSDVKIEQHILKEFMCKEFIKNDKTILSEMILESSQLLWGIFEKQKSLKDYQSICEASCLNDFEIKTFLKENIFNLNEYLKTLCDSKFLKNTNGIEKFTEIFEFISLIPVEYLKEKYQHIVLFNIITVKLMADKQTTDENEKSIERLVSTLDYILFKMIELSYKTPNIFDIFSIDILVDNNVLPLISNDFKTCSNNYKILKLMFERLITKENVHQFKSIIKYLKKEIDCLDSKTSGEKIKHPVFQLSSALFVCLTNFKKVALPSELKASVVKTMNDAREIILNVFDSLKWKALMKNKADLDVSQSDLNETIVDKNIEGKWPISVESEVAMLNLLDAYALLVQNQINLKADMDAKVLKNLKKAFKNFLILSKTVLSNVEIVFHHAKGSSMLINIVLKNINQFEDEKLLQEREAFLSDIFVALLHYVQNDDKRVGGHWLDILNVNLENVKCVFELATDKTFSALVAKYCSGNFSVSNTIVQNSSLENAMRVTKILWTCLMNSNLKSHNKTETRLNVLKEICGSFKSLCQQMTDREMKKMEELKEGNKIKVASNKNDLVLKEETEKVAVCFQVASQFVSMKKIPLSSVIIDNIMQLPLMMLSMDSNDDSLSVDTFKEKFDICSNLVNALLIHRSELLQDRWPCFLQAYRKLLKALCIKSQTDKSISKEELEKLISMAMTIERITQSMVKNEKQELSRISSYLVADIISSYHKLAVVPEVKFHIEKCVYCLFDLLDTHSVGFLMRNMQDSQRLIFQQIHQNYNRYYKYTGTS